MRKKVAIESLRLEIEADDRALARGAGRLPLFDAIVRAGLLRDWTPVMDPWVQLGAPLLGAVIGLFAGVYPALRAATLEPVEALRAGM